MGPEGGRHPLAAPAGGGAPVAAGRADVVIVGAGVVGLACAEAISRRGRSVRLLERNRIGRGASWANCGLVTPSHALPLARPGVLRHALADLLRRDAPIRIAPRPDPALIAWLWRFARASTSEGARRGAAARAAMLTDSYTRLAALIREEGIACEWREAGLLLVHATGETLDAAAEEDALLGRLGVEVRRVEGDALAAFEPALRPGLAGGRFLPGDGHLQPHRLVEGLATVLSRRGVSAGEGVEVRGFLRERGRVVGVLTGDGPVRARDTILATGAWAPLLARRAGLRLPIQPGKGYTVTSAPPAAPPRRPLLYVERKVAVTPWSDAFRVGSTMEFAGYDGSLSPVRLAALDRAAREILRDGEPSGPRQEWCGWRPMSADDLPIVGPAPGLPGLWLAAGHGMLGTSLAAATGAMLAAMLEGEAPAVDPAPFAAGRFGG